MYEVPALGKAFQTQSVHAALTTDMQRVFQVPVGQSKDACAPSSAQQDTLEVAEQSLEQHQKQLVGKLLQEPTDRKVRLHPDSRAVHPGAHKAAVLHGGVASPACSCDLSACCTSATMPTGDARWSSRWSYNEWR